MTVNQLRRMVLMIFAMTAMASAHGQQGQWAAADNPTAKFVIDAERQWAEAACTHNTIAQKILADDFQGTSSEGQHYTKSEEVSDAADTSKSAQDCRSDRGESPVFWRQPPDGLWQGDFSPESQTWNRAIPLPDLDRHLV